MIHALVILLVLLTAAPLAGYLAMPALAALLMMTAWNMSEPHKWKTYWATPREERLLLLLTLLLTVLADLTVAIGVGVAVGLAIRLRDNRLKAAEWHPPEP
jgi:SulP family sulfate permease